ncbi:MAG TPA: DNA-processing protein DprA [Chthoniobacteraceae bacterium]|nr:DNA-processing protein DprA [Chthoniobacteraceae bacterium]
MTETEACIALNMVQNLGPVRLRKLLEVFETPERVLLARGAELRAVDGIGGELANAIACWEQHVDLAAELKRIEEFGARVVTQAAPEYPRELRQIYNPPIVLYVWGTLTERDHRAISIVGSRKTSHYGTESSKRLAYQLAYAGLTVVSGLARGIDTAAHQGALAAQGRTVAVIGSGLMDLYPPENRGLAEKIVQSGAVVSEFPMTFPPDRQTFPYRNRIVAGWGAGLLVVEAGASSGALITAAQALEHGRLVYAVPGQIDRPTSMGSNRLIQQGAKLVLSANDILDDLSMLFPQALAAKSAGENSAAPALSEEEEKVLSATDTTETALDHIIAASGLPAARVSATLLTLEMKRRVKQLPGQQFVRLV